MFTDCLLFGFCSWKSLLQKYEKTPYPMYLTAYFSFLFVSAYSEGDIPKCFLKMVEK